MLTCIVALAMGLDEKKKIGWDDGREIYIKIVIFFLSQVNVIFITGILHFFHVNILVHRLL